MREAVEISGRLKMSNARDGFDPVGVIVDWIDACKARRLDALVKLYDDAATIECCEGGIFRGQSDVEKYWWPKLARPTSNTFEIDALMTEADGVSLDYRGYDGRPMRTHFRFNEAGKIMHSACAPIKEAA
jgi:hypothetical protein